MVDGEQTEFFTGTASLETNLSNFCNVTINRPPKFNIDDYDFLEFDGFGIFPPLTTFTMRITLSKFAGVGDRISVTPYVTVDSSWQHVQVPLGDFGVAAGTSIAGIGFNENTSKVRGHVLFDNLRFVEVSDATPPTLDGVTFVDLNTLKVTFSEKVSSTDAVVAGNYELSSITDSTYQPAKQPTSAVLEANETDVTLTFADELRYGHPYAVTVNGVTDLDGNAIATDSSFDFVAPIPTPTVTGVDPASGTEAVGTVVTITGTGFAYGAIVAFGGQGSTAVVVVDSTTITATTPAHASGAVGVVVTNSNELSGALPGGFTFAGASP